MFQTTLLVGAAIGALAVQPARAADRAEAPLIVHEPAWVKPMETPKASTATPAGPIRLLLEDVQVQFGPDGDETYMHRAVQFMTQEGLAAGALQFGWNPETDVLMVHKLRILRGGETIDILASGQAFTVLRRETNLERAMLDGTLTATLQPEGLQVGDVLEMSITLKRRDPTLQGRSETFNFLRSGKIDRLGLRYVWPASKPMRWVKSQNLPEPKISKTDAGSEVVFAMKDVEPTKLPERAPPRFSALSQVELTQFADWAEVSSVMAPLYAKASTLGPNSPLKLEADKIATASTDPKARAAAALKLVQDRTRYLYLGMNFGAYTPADADVTWGRRFGDCKGKTAMLLALLKSLGIEAQPAFVSTTQGDGLDARLPAMEMFDHVIVRARIGGKTYWLDGTRVGDLDLDQIDVPPFKWALPVQASGAALEKLDVPPSARPLIEGVMKIDARAGLWTPAPVRAEAVFRGDLAVAMQKGLSNLSKEDADKALKQFWNGQANWIEVKTTATHFDPLLREARLTMDGTAAMSWSPAAQGAPLRYETDNTAMGSQDEFKRETKGFETLPYQVPFPLYVRYVEEIQLPRGGAGFSLSGADVDTTLAGVSYARHAQLNKGVMTVEASTRSMVSEVPAAEVERAKTPLRALAGDQLYIVGPAHWRDGDAELALRTSRAPVTANEFVSHGDAWLIKGDYAKAMTSFDAAIKLKPEDPAYRNARCFAKAQAGKALEDAMADCAEALRLSPKDPAYLDSRGLVWMRMGKFDEAMKDYNAALALSPNLASSLFMRGVVEIRQGKAAEGQADVKAGLTLDPFVAEDYARFGIKP